MSKGHVHRSYRVRMGTVSKDGCLSGCWPLLLKAIKTAQIPRLDFDKSERQMQNTRQSACVQYTWTTAIYIYIWIQKITKHWCASAMYSICLASSWVACANGTSKCLSTSETKKISNLTVGCFWLSSSFWPWSLSSLRRGQEVQAPKWCRQSGTDPLLRPLDDTHMFNFRLKPWEIMFHNEYNESTSSRKHKEMGRSSKIFQKSWNISMSFSETAAGGGYLMPALSSSLSLVGMRHSKSFLLGWLLFLDSTQDMQSMTQKHGRGFGCIPAQICPYM